MTIFSNEHIIERTQNWVRSFIIKLNICPFAKREVEKGTVKFHVSLAKKQQQALEELLIELISLDRNEAVETTLFIFPSLFNDFFQYLDFVDYAELLLREQEYEGIYQLATFHPDYCFADTDVDDVSKYTNRSPYPMLHILREESLEKAIAYYGDTGVIPENNINTMQNLGLKKVQEILEKL